MVGDGRGVWSFVHIADAAQATVVAVARGRRGIYNIVDDDPASVAEWLPAVADALGAKPPRRVPLVLGRLLAGEVATVMMTDVRGASNAKAKESSAGRPATRAGVRDWCRRPLEPQSPDRLLDEPPPGGFAIAYRMLGSVAEAEDIVQEALLRVHARLEAGEAIESPRGLRDDRGHAPGDRRAPLGAGAPRDLCRRLAARAARDRAAEDPARQAEFADSLSLAFLVLLESLSPEQRAVLLLRDVFDYGYPEIAAIIGRTEDSVRQLAARARRHLEHGRPRFEAPREQRDELAARFFAAARDGDLAGLEALLADDVVLRGDGGGKVPALARSLQGRARVARTLLAWGRQGRGSPGRPFARSLVNGQPGALLLDGGGRVISVMALEIAGGQIRA